jgi:hypothetical protein
LQESKRPAIYLGECALRLLDENGLLHLVVNGKTISNPSYSKLNNLDQLAIGHFTLTTKKEKEMKMLMKI